jgi:superfamily II RNA helicase
MLAHRTGSACAALKKAVRLTKHVSEAIVSAQLPDLQVAGNAAITSALLTYKKDATEAQRESARAKIEAYARSLDTLLEDLNKQQVASCQAGPRLTQRKTPANPSLTIPSPLVSFNPSSPPFPTAR